MNNEKNIYFLENTEYNGFWNRLDFSSVFIDVKDYLIFLVFSIFLYLFVIFTLCFCSMKIKVFSWFTLVELVISITVIAVVITGVSVAMLQIASHHHYTQRQMDVYSDVKDFLLDTEYLEYSSGVLLTAPNRFDSLMLYNASGWILIGAFRQNATMTDLKLSLDSSVYGRDIVWIFEVSETVKDSILTNTGTVYSYGFNRWKLYKNLLAYQLDFQSISTGALAEMNLKCGVDYLEDFDALPKRQISFPADSYIELQFYF